MTTGALLVMMAAGLSGSFLLATWLGMGGHQRDRANPSRFSDVVVFGHVGFACVAFVLWLFYVVLRTSALAWTAAVVLVVVLALGLGMFVRWLPQPHHGAPYSTAEQGLSVTAVAIHGALAAATAALVVLSVIRI
ncbi:MAG TPA: hypothetical protein VFV00_19505 [Acidimicrobiales bacterium]|nr:hypothetical protein [Acidimicrobiales bacterium]